MGWIEDTLPYMASDSPRRADHLSIVGKSVYETTHHTTRMVTIGATTTSYAMITLGNPPAHPTPSYTNCNRLQSSHLKSTALHRKRTNAVVPSYHEENLDLDDQDMEWLESKVQGPNKMA